MGLIKGTLTLSKYRVIGSLPNDFRNFTDKRIKLFAFRELSMGGNEKSIGWTSLENILDTNFEYANYSLADYLIFSLRIDRKVISPSLLKLKILEAERQLIEERGKSKIYKEERNEIRERVHLSLLSQTPPTPSFHEICWNVSQGWLLFGSLSEKVREDFEDIFKRTFDLTLRHFIPWDTNYMDPKVAERVLSINSNNLS
ncbi:MAG: recombination-associated protein RdgC [Proteobacteria bacterium]|nr:recombination-associated protein RdgC [Pseudomonadota bacterium]